jgi:hypothetical protein
VRSSCDEYYAGETLFRRLPSFYRLLSFTTLHLLLLPRPAFYVRSRCSSVDVLTVSMFMSTRDVVLNLVLLLVLSFIPGISMEYKQCCTMPQYIQSLIFKQY